MNITVLGAGAWGTAMALHLHRLGHRVSLAPRRMEQALKLASGRENTDYLPGYRLPLDLQIGCEVRPLIMEADVVVLACPTVGLADCCEALKKEIGVAEKLRMVITLCKGMELDSLRLPSEVVREILPAPACGTLTGPSYAGEVADGKPTALVLASNAPEELACEVQQAFSGESLRIYRSDDLVGAELGGGLKNIYAIGAGIGDGLGLGDNAKAAYLTRALHEMVRALQILGGRTETAYGLAGFGDLVATCSGAWSRNRSFGEALACGESVEALLKDRRTVVEGYRSTESFFRMFRKKNQEMPILNQLHAVLYEGKPPHAAIGALMQRELKSESA